MPDFSVATIERNTADTGYQVQQYAIEGSTVTPVGSPIPIPFGQDVRNTIIRSSKYNSNICYVGLEDHAQPDISKCRLYKVELDTGTVTLLNVFGYNVPQIAIISDIVTEHDREHAWIVVANTTVWGDDWSGFSFAETPDGGIWESDGGPATFVARGHEFAYHQYNINHRSGISQLAIGEFDGRKFVIHTGTENPGVSSFWPSNSVDDVNWNDLPNNGALQHVGGTASGNIGSIQYHTELDPPMVWWLNGNSGTGSYSFPTTHVSGVYYPDTDTYLYPWAINIRTGARGGLFYLGSGRGVLVVTQQGGFLSRTTSDNGQSWAVAHNYGTTNTVEFNGWELHRWEPWFVAVSHQGGISRRGFIHWTMDEGLTWSDVDLGLQQPTSVTFIYTEPAPAPVPTVYRELLTWRDARGFTGNTVFYTAALDLATAAAQAYQIQEVLKLGTNAELQAALGPNTEPPQAATYGSNLDAYSDIEDLAHLEFGTDLGPLGGIWLPAPKKDMFLPDGVVLDWQQETVSTIAATLLANNLCNRGGVIFTAFTGGHYSRKNTRQRHTIYTRDTDLAGPGL